MTNRTADRRHEDRVPDKQPAASKATDRQQTAQQLEAGAENPRTQTQRTHIAQLRDSAPVAHRADGLPAPLRQGIESLSGMDMSGVRVHRNSSKPAALQAHAYAQGSDIHLGPGQEKHLPHEAWHLVQQRQGRVRATGRLQGVALNDQPALEAEADRMGAQAGRVAQRRAAPHSAGCCCGNCGGAGVRQLVPGGLPALAVQLKTSVSISDGTRTVAGESGNEDSTRSRMAQWPQLQSSFESVVHSRQMPTLDDDGRATGETYSRNRYMCAEPNALANLLHHHASSTSHGLTNAYLGSLSFPALAVDDTTGKSIAPCPVCSQWVTAAAPMSIHTLGAVNMVNQREIEARDERRRAEQVEQEAAAAKAKQKEQKTQERQTHSEVDLAIEATIIKLNAGKKAEVRAALQAALPASTGKRKSKPKVFGDDEITAYLRGWMGSLSARSKHEITVLATFDEGQAGELTSWARSNFDEGD